MKPYVLKVPFERGVSFFQRAFLDRWQVATLSIAGLVLTPLGVVLFSVFSETNDVWLHFVQTSLVTLLANTFWLLLGVGVGTTFLGVSLAWLTAACDFPGRKWLDWALMLPLSLPPYVVAFVGIGLLDFTGPVQTQLRSWLGAEPLWFPKIRSTGGVIAVMTLTLYPYVYMLARNAFLTQGRRAIEAAQSLGQGRLRGFLHVALPMARPWIAGGLALVLMETLADFGTVSIFNYDTFTTAIYKAWFGLFSLSAAAQLASLLVLIVFIVLLIEQRSRSRRRFSHAGRSSVADRIPLRGGRGWLAFAYAISVLGIAFIIPVGQLSVWAFGVFQQDFDLRYLSFLGHSVFLGGAAALLTCAGALILVSANRLRNDLMTRTAVRVATLGYALPGSVLAVGIFIPLIWIDKQMIEWIQTLFGIEIGFILNGTLAAMLLAYLIRFLAVAHGAVDSAMNRITPSLDETARCLGVSGVPLLRRVYLPMLRGGLLTAALLVFVDVMKEMPITLMTRPFGWDTLSVRIFEMTSEGQWERAALPAVALVLAGFIPILLLSRYSNREP
ncbi:iron ABC transporter permease [Nitrospiraceae bacterium HYJII51-Mn-bac16s-1-B09]|uniref:Iron ABC transporter permease n=2 Tax=Candidatus Manganitrophus noduliformans TaxID=2606439 RepID=A0A7X6DSP9_9BACT|nr:iron ABC transporter permease [Candidatus Manganitrophus noduliformans]